MRMLAAFLWSLFLASPASAQLWFGIDIASSETRAITLAPEVCVTFAPTPNLRSFVPVEVTLPDVPDARAWGVVLRTDRDVRMVPIPAIQEGSRTRRMILPYVEWADGRIAAEIMVIGDTASGKVECPGVAVTLTPPPISSGAWPQLTEQSVALMERANLASSGAAGAMVFPPAVIEQLWSHLIAGIDAYDDGSTRTRRAMDAVATLALDESARLLLAMDDIRTSVRIDPIRAMESLPSAVPAIWRLERDAATLWEAGYAMAGDCPATPEDFVAMRSRVAGIDDWNRTEGALLKDAGAMIGALAGAGVTFATVNPEVGAAVEAAIGVQLSINGMVDDFRAGMIPTEMKGIDLILSGTPVFEDSPSAARIVRIESVALRIESRGWDAAKAAFDAGMTLVAAAGPGLDRADSLVAARKAKAKAAREATTGTLQMSDKFAADAARYRAREAARDDPAGNALSGGAEGTAEGGMIGKVQSAYSANGVTLKLDPVKCRIEILESDLWTSEVVDLPHGNALVPQGKPDTANRIFRAVRAGTGAVTVTIDPARLKVPPALATGTAAMEVPELTMEIVGSSSLSGGSATAYGPHFEEVADWRALGMDAEVVISGAVAWSWNGDDLILTSTDACEPGSATIIATPRGAFLEESDAESRAVTRTVAVVVDRARCEEDEDDEEEMEEETEPFDGNARGMICGYGWEPAPGMVGWQRFTDNQCHENQAPFAVSVGAGGAWVDVKSPGWITEIDGAQLVVNTWDDRFFRTDLHLWDIVDEILFNPYYDQLGPPGSPMVLMEGEDEAASFLAANPAIYRHGRGNESSGAGLSYDNKYLFGLGDTMYVIFPPLVAEPMVHQQFMRLTLEAAAPSPDPEQLPPVPTLSDEAERDSDDPVPFPEETDLSPTGGDPAEPPKLGR